MLKAQAAAERQDLAYGQTLIDEVKAIKADAKRLQLTGSRRPTRHPRGTASDPRASGHR
jgi:hypothetical protein